MSALRAEDALADYVGELLAASASGFSVAEASQVDDSGSGTAAPLQDCPVADLRESEGDSTAEEIALWCLSDGPVKLAVPCEEVSRFVTAQAVAATGGSSSMAAELDGVLHRIVDPSALLGQVTAAPESYAVCSRQALLLAVGTAPERRMLARGDVLWRGSSGQRPWLAGTAPGARCALLDLPGLVRHLDAAVTPSGT